MDKNSGDRGIENIPYFLMGSYFSVRGTVTSIRCRGIRKILLLTNVMVGDRMYSHTWMTSDHDVKIGDQVSFLSRIGWYKNKGINKWWPIAPYLHFSKNKI